MKTLQIDPQEQIKKITKFIQDTINKQGFEKTIVAVSGGIDSATTVFLAVKALGKENVFCLKMPAEKQKMLDADLIIDKLGIHSKNKIQISISPVLKKALQTLDIKKERKYFNIRKGNLAARIRMMLLYDTAKKKNLLVCGTENRSEHLLGYYTRFGDEASDLEPIKHLYKTQIYKLAEYLDIPQPIIDKEPSAGLWPGQTDSDELEFTYQEADPVLHLYFDKNIPIEKIELPKTEKIIKWVGKNKFKTKVPYSLF